MTDENNNSLVNTKIPDIMKPVRSTGLAFKRKQVEEKLKEINPAELPNRIGLIFDDSGSMSGQPLEDAKIAVQNFTNICNRFDTSLALYLMNGKKRNLTIDYSVLNVLVVGINDAVLGGMPLYQSLQEMASTEDVTRIVLFSDGDPSDRHLKEQTMNILKNEKFNKPVDTIYIGYKDTSGFKEMQWIAEQTGGIFIHFEDSKSLNKNLKYLSPALRPLLANAEIKDKIQRGESI